MTTLRVAALAGGIGAARFLRGLVKHLAVEHPDSEVAVVGNTADDLILFGLHVSPDLDTVMYTLGGGVDESQGWGRAEESFVVQHDVAAYGVQPQWFALGDRDIATHIARTQMLAGYPLSVVTSALSKRWFAELPVPVSLIPMTDDRVETHVVVQDADQGRRAIHFQEWWVRYRAGLPAEQILLVGIERATPAPGVLEVVRKADVVLLPPSNPVVSIGPIVSVPGVRDALRTTDAPVVGLSPIIRGRPVRGMADACLKAIGVETSTAAVAQLYGDFLDGWLIDESDAVEVDQITQAGPTARAVPLLMTNVDAAAAIARAALDLAGVVRP